MRVMSMIKRSDTTHKCLHREASTKIAEVYGTPIGYIEGSEHFLLRHRVHTELLEGVYDDTVL